MTGSVQYELRYFPIRGLGELPRMIMECGDIKYQNSYPTDWTKEKSTAPFGQLPMLMETTKDGKVFTLAQSSAISRYLAHKAGIAGRDEHQTALLESMYESIVDIRTHWIKAFYSPEDKKKVAFDSFFAENLPNWALFNERFFASTSEKFMFLTGNDITYVDLFLFIMVDGWIEMNPKAIDCYPTMKKVHQNVKNHSKISAYLKSDRRHPSTMK